MSYDDAHDHLIDPEFAEYMQKYSPMALMALNGCHSEFMVFTTLQKTPYLKNVRSPGDATNTWGAKGKDVKQTNEMVPDFYYEYKGKTFSHEHKTIKNEKSNAPLRRLRIAQKLLKDENRDYTYPFYNLFDIVSVDLRYADKVMYIPMFRVPLHKKIRGRHPRQISPKQTIQIGHISLSDALDDIIANESLIKETERGFKEELGFSAYSGISDSGISQKLDKKTGLERFFIL